MERIGIEDFCEDIVAKAQRGRGLSDAALAAAAGIDGAAIRRVKAGDCSDEVVLRRIAGPLGLDAGKLVESARRAWYPEVEIPPGLFMANTPYHDMRVNAYVIWDPESRKAAVFDTGADAGALLRCVEDEGLVVEGIFLTHGHNDHILDLARLKAAWPDAAVRAGEKEGIAGAEPVREGATFSVGGLEISALLTWGHSRGGMTFFVEGLARPVAVVGDAVFAGSMGGGMVSYEAALSTNREKILRLPGETVLCPGHGPLSTVAQEREHNPFF